MRTTLDDSQDDAGTLSQGDLDFLVSLQFEGIETDSTGYRIWHHYAKCRRSQG